MKTELHIMPKKDLQHRITLLEVEMTRINESKKNCKKELNKMRKILAKL